MQGCTQRGVAGERATAAAGVGAAVRPLRASWRFNAVMVIRALRRMGLRQNDPVGRIFQHVKPAFRHPQWKARLWRVNDENELAHAIADLALGQWAHVVKLLETSDEWKPANADYAIDGAIRDLTVAPGKDPWHRDGWVFQMISWIVAVESGKGPVRAPQMDQASKGFDGLQIRMSGKSVKRVILFEDKATDSPRDTVREKVWPEFEDLEAGTRNHALSGEIASLLSTIHGIDPATAVDRIMRKPRKRSYRVSVTTGEYHARAADFNGLFDGYEGVVKGARRRRHGHVLELEDLRPWMNALCDRAIQLLESRRSHV